MRPLLPVLLTGLTLGAAACTTTGDESSPAAPFASAPAPVEGYDWFFHEDDQDARLAYGVENSDDLRLGLDCRRGSGRLDLTALGGEDAPAEIHLESGGDTERYPAKSEPDLLHDGVILTAEAKADDPVFQRFRRLGWVALWRDQEREAYAAHPASADRIERFFAFCG